MSDQPKPSAQEVYEGVTTAVMLTMAATIHALARAGAVRLETVVAVLETMPPHHPNPMAQELARRMTTALAQSLTLSSDEGGRA